MDCNIHVAKTKALISCAVTTQLICVFVFAYAKSRFSHEVAQVLIGPCGCAAELHLCSHMAKAGLSGCGSINIILRHTGKEFFRYIVRKILRL